MGKERDIKYGQSAREALLLGMDKLAGAVCPTYGPRGRNAAYNHMYLPPEISNDGISISKKVYPAEAYEALGAELLRGAAQATENQAGDGTTLTVILTYELIREGVKALSAGYNPILLRKGMRQARDMVLERLRRQAIPVDTPEQIGQIAAVSAGDPEVGKLVSEAYEKAGKNGVVWVEESWGLESEVKYTQGILLEGGYYSSAFARDEALGKVEYENPYLLIVNQNIRQLEELLPVMEEAFAKDVPLIIVAQDMKDEVTAMLTKNMRKLNMKLCVVKMPYHGDSRRAAMEDLAMVTGAFCYNEDCGRKLSDMTLEDCGCAKKVFIDKKNTIITGTMQDTPEIQKRIGKLWVEFQGQTDEYEQEKFLRRISFLTGGISVIYPGGYSELEIIEKKKRLEDAVNSVRVAVTEGVLPGGGCALLHASPEVERLARTLEGDEREGVEIVAEALKRPVAILIENADGQSGRTVEELLKSEKDFTGYDGVAGQITNLWEAGVLDAAKVVSSALENAVSMASAVLTTEAVVADLSGNAHQSPWETI